VGWGGGGAEAKLPLRNMRGGPPRVKHRVAAATARWTAPPARHKLGGRRSAPRVCVPLSPGSMAATPRSDAAIQALLGSYLMRGIPRPVVEQLAHEVRRTHYPAGTTVLRQGGPRSEWLFLIESGTAHVESTDGASDGMAQLVEVCGEGDVFGAASVMDRSPEARARFTVRAHEDTVCYLIPRDRVHWLADRFPGVADTLSARNHRLLRRATAEIAARDDPGAAGLALGSQVLVEAIGGRVRRAPVVCPPDVPIADAARRMTEARVDSILVVDAERRAIGIVTDSDLRRLVVAQSLPSTAPVSSIMSHPVVSVRQVEPALEALRLMSEHGINHLVVVDESRLARGVISSADLLFAQANTPAAVLRDLETASDLDGLAAARARLHTLLEELVRVGVEPENATRVITALNDRASRRALAWAEAETVAEFTAELGAPFQPPPFCWLALGSEGREEQTLATDQDNALVHGAPPDDAVALRWLDAFGRRATDALERLGFPRCPGGVMASTPHWRRSLSGWRDRLRHWIAVPDEQAMLESAIFLDFRPLFGDASFADSLRETVRAEIPRNDIYLAHLTRASLRNRPPLGLIRTFATERSGDHRDTLNLKERGMAPLVDAARVLALGRGIPATNTFERFAAAADTGAIGRDLAEDAREAYAFLMLLRLQHHLALQVEGRAPDNHLNPHALSSLQRRTLKVAFQVVQAVQESLSSRFGGYGLG
jgi:CBS domain-containing protein